MNSNKKAFIDFFIKYRGKYACAIIGKKMGVIDLSGNMIIPAQYDNIFLPLVDIDLLAVCKKNKYGYINLQNEIVIPIEYDYAGAFGSDSLALVSKEKKLYFINDKAEIVLTLNNYIGASSFSERLAEVIDANKLSGYVNIKGEEVIAPKYKSAEAFNNGLAIVEQVDGLMGLIDTLGNEVLTPKYKDIFFLSQNYIKAITIQDKEIYFDTQGNEIHSFSKYQHLDTFINGYASVSLNGEYGLVDSKGTLVIPCRYSSTLILEEGSDLVVTSYGALSYGAFSLITGKEIIPFNNLYISNLGNNRYLIEKHKGSRILVDEKNNVIAEYKHKLYNKYTFLYIAILAAVAYWFFFT